MWHQVGLAAALCASIGSVWSAERNHRAECVVDNVLREEARGGLGERTAPLAQVRDNSNRARWASGFVERDSAWVRYDAPATNETCSAYRTERGAGVLTAARHAELANWCFEHGLPEEGRAHLAALVSLNPQQPAVWQRLGYQRVGNEWVHPDDMNAASERQQQRDRDHKFWRPRVQAIVQKLTNPNAAVQAAGRQQLQEIDDRAALPTLEAALCGSTPELAVEFLDWARKHPSVESTTALARQSIIAPWEPVRTAAAEALQTRRADHYAPALLSLLATPIESRAATASTALVRGRVVFFYQAQRETADAIQRSNYVVTVDNSTTIGIWLRNRRDIPRLNRIGAERNRNDLERLAQAEIEQRLAQNARDNEAQQELNQLVSKSLSVATATSNPLANPAVWWQWWHAETATEPVADKPVVEVTETDNFQPAMNLRALSSCLPAGTPIRTAEGWQPIETIQIGDRVLAKSIETGELAERPVVWTTVRSAQPLVRLHFGQETIAATRGHYFWVSGKGWRMAKELKSGDRLHTVDGTVMLTDVSPGSSEPVYNLVVDQANSYFVGQSLILSHDVTPPIPTNIIVPGLQP
jgi:hypothetical protein